MVPPSKKYPYTKPHGTLLTFKEPVLFQPIDVITQNFSYFFPSFLLSRRTNWISQEKLKRGIQTGPHISPLKVELKLGPELLSLP